MPNDSDVRIFAPAWPRPSGRAGRRLSVLMPVYNERWTLAEILRRVLASPVSLDIEVVAVDDGSTDGSWEALRELARADRRIRPFAHDRNRGKGAAIRTAIAHMTGDVAVIQDADLEYDPGDYPQLLAPILGGEADAVYGSRFAGGRRRVQRFWHTLANKTLTLVSNALNDQNLTDMETCYKAVRCDILRRLRLESNTFTLEPEITCRLAQWGARVWEVPIRYNGRSFAEGKKIRPWDAAKAVGQMLKCRFLATRFTDDWPYYAQREAAKHTQSERWLLRQARPFLGARVLDARAGLGARGALLLGARRLTLAEGDPRFVEALKHRFAARENVEILPADLACSAAASDCEGPFDTILCADVLERADDDRRLLAQLNSMLAPGGHCLVLAPTGRRADSDALLGRRRRYSAVELKRQLESAGFDVLQVRQFGRVEALRRRLTGAQLPHSGQLHPAGQRSLLCRTLDVVLPASATRLLVVAQRPALAEKRRVA